MKITQILMAASLYSSLIEREINESRQIINVYSFIIVLYRIVIDKKHQIVYQKYDGFIVTFLLCGRSIKMSYCYPSKNVDARLIAGFL